MNEDLLDAPFEGMVAMQVGDFVGEVELVLWPTDPFLPQSPKPLLVGKMPVISTHIKPNPLEPVFTPNPPPTLYGCPGILPVSCATELPELGAAPPRRSFTQLEFGVQVQAPAYSLVLPTPKVLQYG